MKTKNLMKGMLALLLILAFVVLPSQVLAARAKAVRPSIKILKVKTLNDAMELQTEFDLWNPVLFRIRYEVTGDADTKYKVKGIVKLFGESITVEKKHYPGEYRMLTAMLVPGRVKPGVKTVNYKVKLKKGGKLLDKDKATLQITIPEPNPDLGYLHLREKDPRNWSVVRRSGRGLLRHTRCGSLFVFRFHAQKLTPGANYTLIYYPDPWLGEGLICLASGTANYHGQLRQMIGAVKINDGLPAEHDLNYPGGAKIWLVRSEDVDCDGKMMVDWNPRDYLFEYNLITYDPEEGCADLGVVEPLSVDVKMLPQTLNLTSRETWVSARIEFPEGYSVNDVDVDSISLEDSIAASKPRGWDNGLTVKFKKAALQDLIESMGLEYPEALDLYVTGQFLDGTPFQGSDVVTVIK
ncbi:MAG: hypothetical protein JRJ47_10830 [Deltaproteobacteria bacterium]|nr:hypothetical protein [Deltaproteobacteria bacterium]